MYWIFDEYRHWEPLAALLGIGAAGSLAYPDDTDQSPGHESGFLFVA
jgi:hypothetical protein